MLEAIIRHGIGIFFVAGAFVVPISVHVIRVDGGLHFQVIWQGHHTS